MKMCTLFSIICHINNNFSLCVHKRSTEKIGKSTAYCCCCCFCVSMYFILKNMNERKKRERVDEKLSLFHHRTGKFTLFFHHTQFFFLECISATEGKTNLQFIFSQCSSKVTLRKKLWKIFKFLILIF